MALELYHLHHSTCSQKVRICLAEKGVEWVSRPLDFSERENLSPEYMAINPNGVVPAFVHDGTPIIESTVMCEYLDEVWPNEPRLSPDDPKKRAEMRAWLRFIDEVPSMAVRVPSFQNVFLDRFKAMNEEEYVAFRESNTLRRDFFGHERLVATLYRAVKPDPAALEFAERVAGILALAAAVRTRLRPDPPDISEVMGQITGLLDESIAGLTIREAGPPAIDLSKINFEALAERFKTSKHKNTEIEALKAAIRARLDRLVLLNRTRTDFAEKFEELIESYNAGSRNIEQLFEELLKLSNSLDEEQERHVRENLAEEELVIFDILTRPAPNLSAEERDEVKKVAKDLLGRLKTLLVLNWRQKSAARSQLRLGIEDALDAGLPRAYAPELYKQKCSAVFEHVYESYPERDAGVYAESA